MQGTHYSTPTKPTSTSAIGTGAVAAPRVASVTAGELMLAQGGNAIDAAVAAALVAGVIEPTETTLAGSGFLLFGDRKGKVVSVEFGPKAPQRASETMFKTVSAAQSSGVLGLATVEGNANIDGPLASGVPRTLTGLLETHERYGRLPRRTIMDPAIQAAESGFPADAWFVLNALTDLQRLQKDATARTTFLSSAGLPIGHDKQAYYGSSVEEPAFVKQPTLAMTLDRIADEGSRSVLSGFVAHQLAETFAENGMLLTLEDLQASGPEFVAPRSLQFRDSTVHAASSPGGGLTVLQILRIWQELYPSGSPREDSEARTRNLTLAMKHAFADRYHWIGDPAVVPVPLEELLSQPYARALAGQIQGGPTPRAFGDGSAPWSHFAQTPLHRPTHDIARAPRWSPESATSPTSGTTHISAVDADGMFVAITHTAANHFGSGMVCPRTGLLFDSAMAWFNAMPGSANSIRSGARALANMGPVLLTDDSGASAAIGASGGRRIIGAVAQVVINLIDRGMGASESLNAPRVDASGPELLLPEQLQDLAPSVRDLAPAIVPAASNLFAMDFARSNLASRVSPGHYQTAIDALSHSH